LVLLGSGALLVAAGCATGEEWQIWRSNSAHFASGEHINFSMRNQGAGTPNVRRTDIAMASNQKWWGKAVTVSSDQILGQ
jgi:hypothetical protein